MRMARVNVTIPDELIQQARAAGLNVSRYAASAIEAELERRLKIAALDAYLAELDAELGPLTQAERDVASEWGDRFDASSGTSGAA
jgi:post-segregation antitoxin (ccd killing protein)